MTNRFPVAAIAAVVMAVATDARAQENVCQANVAQVLAEHGVKLSDVANPKWQTQHWSAGGGNGPVNGYQFHGQLASCSNGSLYILLTAGCEIADMYTDGDCMLEGIPHYW